MKSQIETTLTQILRKPDANMLGSFVDSSGDSIAAVRFLDEVKLRFSVDISLEEIFETSTLNELVHRLEE